VTAAPDGAQRDRGVMSFEKPQKGNPHRLTVNQHIHTAHAIGKFEGADGCVEVNRVATGEIHRVHRRDRIFCARRAWDERAEKGYMHDIEDAFHAELVRVQIGGSGARDHNAISRYHLLWALRHRYATATPPKQSWPGLRLQPLHGPGGDPGGEVG
jgi:hypothetical protein